MWTLRFINVHLVDQHMLCRTLLCIARTLTSQGGRLSVRIITNISHKTRHFLWSLFDDMCRIGRWSLWSSFDVNRSTFDKDNARKTMLGRFRDLDTETKAVLPISLNILIGWTINSLDNEIHTKTTFFRLMLTFQLRLKSSSERSV